MTLLDEIQTNAERGLGPCRECPAQEATNGEYVNPGMFNYDAEIMVVTMDPSHDPHWDEHQTWDKYNEYCRERFLNQNWSGYGPLTKLLEPLENIAVGDIWLGDSIKCPVDNSLREVNEREISETFTHCREYLSREIQEVDPSVIVTMGAVSGERVLDAHYDIEVNLSPGHRDCGRIFPELEPPVLVSPHWFHGWLGRETDRRKNLHIIRDRLVELYSGKPK